MDDPSSSRKIRKKASLIPFGVRGIPPSMGDEP
jgi:hypothetical protein